ncbi:tripartite tricarboxylate transporter TctB family protein [Roseovarius sp. A-2]|uniref:tripartite tricarboxylate transporter TctB family protein n=1 Tax=Roseovarius sp. A-2 TaxID=1570360 RepID=UPI0009B544C2|nr:tripartite tricarboxylate transporter TctB family protein [Roseovarius sp. A-2]GAW33651.1 tripartite tricarboxylate transporter TctB family protein [Roseovarius sp. A-2]
MTNRAQDIIVGTVLFLVGAGWTWLVIDSIPPGFGDGEVGPRAFPMAFGLILTVFSAILLMTRIATGAETALAEASEDQDIPNRLDWGSALLVLGQIVLYGFLLEKIGFLLATPVVVLLVMIVSLRVRSLRKLLGMSLGLTVGCWLIFEKLLGIYLANGTWLNVG